MTKSKFETGLWTRRQALKTMGIAGAGLAASSLAAPALRAQGNKPIRFLNCETGKDTLAFFSKAAKEYQEKTGVEVVIDSVPLGESFTKITNGIRSGTPYDVANVGFIGHVLLLAEQEQIVPLNELTDEYQWGNNILFPIDNKVYWYPFDYNLALIYYRKDLYETNGLSLPNTWDAFVQNSEALVQGRQKGALFPIGSNGATNWMSFAFLWAEGVKLFDDQWNVILDNDEMKPRVAAYLDFMTKLYGRCLQVLFRPAIPMSCPTWLAVPWPTEPMRAVFWKRRSGTTRRWPRTLASCPTWICPESKRRSATATTLGGPEDGQHWSGKWIHAVAYDRSHGRLPAYRTGSLPADAT